MSEKNVLLFDPRDLALNIQKGDSEPVLVGGKLAVPDLPQEFIEVMNMPVESFGEVAWVDITAYRQQVVDKYVDQGYTNIPRFAKEYALPIDSSEFHTYQNLMGIFQQPLIARYRQGYGPLFGDLIYENEHLKRLYTQMKSETGMLTHLGIRLLYRDCAALLGEEAAYELQRWEVL